MKGVVDKIISTITEPEDVFGFGISALFDIMDEPYLDKVIKEIRINRKNSIHFAPFLKKLDDFYNDRRSGIERQRYQPLVVSEDVNALTVDGLRFTNENITGEVTTRMNFMMAGAGNSIKPTMYSTRLELEETRVPLDVYGWFFAKGTTLVQGCKFPRANRTATYVEFGSSNVGDELDPDHVLFWRNRITNPADYLEHIQFKTIPIHVHIIDRRSVET
jgi:hypothetical protein